MMNYLKNKSGLALAEALVAVALIGTAAVIVGSIVRSSVNTTQVSQSYLIAQNLATEGIEVVKNVRDTNWLMHPLDQDCWLVLRPSSRCGSTARGRGRYYVNERDNQKYLVRASSTLNLEFYTSRMDEYRLDIADSDLGDFQIYQPSKVSGLDTPSKFYRMIEFDDVSDTEASFQVIVQWDEGNEVREIVRDIMIYNYQF